jgi:hypothetical protein
VSRDPLNTRPFTIITASQKKAEHLEIRLVPKIQACFFFFPERSLEDFSTFCPPPKWENGKNCKHVSQLRSESEQISQIMSLLIKVVLKFAARPCAVPTLLLTYTVSTLCSCISIHCSSFCQIWMTSNMLQTEVERSIFCVTQQFFCIIGLFFRKMIFFPFRNRTNTF